MQETGNLEIEIKVKVDDLSALREKISAGGFRVSGHKGYEYNIVFDTPDRRLKKNGLLLRLRKAGRRHILTFKSPPRGTKNESAGGGYKVREEIESDVSNFENVKAVFESLGFSVFFVYEKYREVYTRGNLKVMIDQTPIGNYIEVEGRKEEIDEICRQLGYPRSRYIAESYYSLFRKTGGKGFMTFKDQNVAPPKVSG